MKKIVLTILVGLIGFCALSQQDQIKHVRDTSEVKHKLGFAGYSDAGFGLSYRYQPNRYGIAITGSPTYFEEIDLGLYSIGLKGLFSFYQSSSFDLYSYLASQYIGFNLFDEQQYVDIYVSGIGVGMDVPILEAFTFNFQIGYGFYIIDERDANTRYYTRVAGGLGFSYNF